MSERQDGGPAFPPQDRVLITPALDVENMERIKQALERHPHSGMSLRDYFAAHALSAIYTDNAAREMFNPQEAAQEAYELADAMLKARGSK